jgi:hypothetical protein
MKTGFISCFAEERDISRRPVDVDSILTNDTATAFRPTHLENFIWEPRKVANIISDPLHMIIYLEQPIIYDWK